MAYEPYGTDGSPYVVTFKKVQVLFSQVFLLDPCQTVSSIPNDQILTRETLPGILAQIVDDAPTIDIGNITYGVCMGMLCLLNKYPTHIDAFLRLFFEAVNISEKNKSIPQDKALICQFAIQMGETRNTGPRNKDFWTYPPVLRPGTMDPVDDWKINYSREDVEENLDNCLNNFRIQTLEGNDYIVRAAVFGRWNVLMNEGKPETEKYGMTDYGIEFSLKNPAGDDNWKRVCFIAAMIRLRSYAKSLLQGKEQKRKAWMDLLGKWLWDPTLNVGNDWMVKQHTLLALKNLKQGPFDESSMELFYSGDWVV